MIAFYPDEDQQADALVHSLRRLGIDVLTTRGEGRNGAGDPDQLRFAGSLGRTIVTSNQSDYARLHVAYLRAGQRHAGIVVVTQQRWGVGEVARRLARLSEAQSPAGMSDELVFLSDVSE